MRWALRAHLFPARTHVDRISSYPTNDGLNFEGIDFPTPVSQIDRLERQNPNLAINVFGWDKEQVIVHRISEQDGNIPRINLMLTHQGENTHYSYVKKLTALLYDQNRHNESKHFCERCLHGYKTKELLERHKPECKGLLKTATRTEMMKEGENKMSFTNFYKQMKAPYVIYADFECIVEKIAGCEPSADKSFCHDGKSNSSIRLYKIMSYTLKQTQSSNNCPDVNLHGIKPPGFQPYVLNRIHVYLVSSFQ